MADYLVVSEKFFEQLHFMDEIARQVQNSGMAVVVDKNLEGIVCYAAETLPTSIVMPNYKMEFAEPTIREVQNDIKQRQNGVK